MRLLVDRVGRERLRPLLGFTAKDQSDPLFATQAAAALHILTAYDKRYCADHPLDTLAQVVDSIVAQIAAHQ